MAVYPKGNKFMASCGSGATRERRTFKTETEALVWEKSQEALKGTTPAPVEASPTSWTLQHAFDQTLRHHWTTGGGVGKATINAQFAIDFFGPHTPINAINSNRVIEYMEHLMEEFDNSPSTLNKKMSALKVILTHALDIGGITTVPRMKRYTEATRSPHWFSDGDERAMLGGCSTLGYPDLADFIGIGLDTGFRKGELLGLVMADYHKDSLLVHADATKGKTARTVPATARVKTILHKRPAGTRQVFGLTPASLRKQWTELRSHLKRDDDPFFIPHTLRHTCATRLVSEGVPLKAVQVWLGHGVIESTMVYAHLAPGQLEMAGKALDSRHTPTAGA